MSLDDIDTLHLVETTEDAMDCLRWLSNKSKIGFDTEGTGLSPETDRVRLVQIGDGREGWAIPFEWNSMLVHDIVKRFEGTYLMFNAPYDVAMCRSSGVNIPIHQVEDVRYKAHVLSSTGPLALKKLCEMHVDPGAANLQDDLKGVFAAKGWNWATIPWTYEAYWMYGAMDPILTYQLDEVLDPEVRRTAPDSYDLEMSAAWPVEQMMRNGVYLDQPYVRAKLAEHEAEAAGLLEQCLAEHGIRPGSNIAVEQALLADGVPLEQISTLGRSGHYSVAKNILDKIDHPLAKLVGEYRKITKLTGTYLEPYLRIVGPDGRIHPKINTVGGFAQNPFEPGGKSGVRTGRMSSSDPNLQNVPMRTPEGKAIRRSFKAMCSERCGCGREHVWMKCDSDQIEQRVMAYMSRDPGMIEAFHSPDDYFVAMARQMFHEPDFQKSDPRRQQVKNGAYADIYGAGPEKFAVTAGMTDGWGDPDVEAARAFLNQMHDAFPGPTRFSKKVIQQANVRYKLEGEAYVRSPLTGRKLVADPGRFYALVNYLIQGMAGELLKMKIRDASASGLDPYMVLAVHDEIDLDVPAHMAEDVIDTLHDIFNDAEILAPVPVSASVEMGPNWGQVKEIES